MEHLPWAHLPQLCLSIRRNRYVKAFTCADQFRCMAFAQLTYRTSLRDIEPASAPSAGTLQMLRATFVETCCGHFYVAVAQKGKFASGLSGIFATFYFALHSYSMDASLVLRCVADPGFRPSVFLFGQLGRPVVVVHMPGFPQRHGGPELHRNCDHS